MRLAIFESAADLGQGNLRLGVVDGEQIHDATDAVPGLTAADLGSQGLGPVIAAWDDVKADVQDAPRPVTVCPWATCSYAHHCARRRSSAARATTWKARTGRNGR